MVKDDPHIILILNNDTKNWKIWSSMVKDDPHIILILNNDTKNWKIWSSMVNMIINGWIRQKIRKIWSNG